MKRWAPWFLVVLIAALAIIVFRPSASTMMRDTDTQGLLRGIRERRAPLSWFVSDWPIENHFYRPISTLTLEMDNALHGDAPDGYGLTNAVICAFGVLSLFWFLREVTDKPAAATGGALLFASYLLPTYFVAQLSMLLAVGSFASLVGIARGGKKHLWPVLIGLLVTQFAASELASSFPLYGRALGWIPGRTATSMTVFALCALAAYVRFERSSAKVAKPAPTPLDPPATKGTVVRRVAAKWSHLWVALAWLFTVLALGCYEQAVMIPAIALTYAWSLRVLGAKTRWWPHVGFWCVLALYVVVRMKYVPLGASAYQAQQMRHGPGGWIELAGWLMPGAPQVVTGLDTLSTSALMLLTAPLWFSLLAGVANVVAWVGAAKQHKAGLLLLALVAATLAYLPMSFLKYFEHYLYWPAALKTLYVLFLLGIAAKAWANAVALPTLQAPSRLRPAPGSLPRP